MNEVKKKYNSVSYKQKYEDAIELIKVKEAHIQQLQTKLAVYKELLIEISK